MSKRVIKGEGLKRSFTILRKIFVSQGDGRFPLLFYKADTEGLLRGAEIDQMVEYLTTGLKELQDNIQWRREFLSENAEISEIKMLEVSVSLKKST